MSTVIILEQLSEATRIAKAENKPIYVYRDHFQWFISGKMPAAAEYYIAYPNGQFDKSPEAPDLERDQKAINPPMPITRSSLKTFIKGFDSMDSRKKIFIGLCAFAPYLMTALSFLFSPGDPWKMAWITSLMAMPLSVFFSLVAIYKPKDGRIASIASTLASNGHLIFYAHLYYLVVINEQDPGVFPVTLTAALMMSGVGLLLIWDNDVVEKA